MNTSPSVPKPKTITIAPKPRLLLGLMNQKWTIAEAINEFVDNSFGLGRGNASRVNFLYDQTHRILTVVDNGQGMEGLIRLFQLGNTIGRTVNDIGLYGSGGTMALLWLGSQVTVQTLRADGQTMFDTLNWYDVIEADDFKDIRVSDEWVKDCFISRDGEEKYSGTGITGHVQLGEGWQPFLNTTKNGINDEGLWNEMMRFLFTELRGLLKKIDEEQSAILFKDLELKLEAVINGKDTHLPVVIDRRGWIDHVPPRKYEHHEHKDKNNLVRVSVIGQNNDLMSSRICYAMVSGGTTPDFPVSLTVYVNIDNVLVKSAWIKKPQNIVAINLMVTREIAQAISTAKITPIGSRPIPLVEMVFKPIVQDVIDQRPEEERVGYIQGLLVARLNRIEEESVEEEESEAATEVATTA